MGGDARPHRAEDGGQEEAGEEGGQEAEGEEGQEEQEEEGQEEEEEKEEEGQEGEVRGWQAGQGPAQVEGVYCGGQEACGGAEGEGRRPLQEVDVLRGPR